MDIQEYINLSKQHNEDIELDKFVTVWLKSRLPLAYKELEHSFRQKESLIYAHRECEANNIDF